MAEKSINWLDILVHVAVAVPAGAAAGAGLQMGFAYGGVVGTVLAVLSGAGGLLAAALYWPVREKLQHQRQWGGLQSTLEWVVPVAVLPFGAVAGWWISRFLM